MHHKACWQDSLCNVAVGTTAVFAYQYSEMIVMDDLQECFSGAIDTAVANYEHTRVEARLRGTDLPVRGLIAGGFEQRHLPYGR